jgi:hypothetical protein
MDEAMWAMQATMGAVNTAADFRGATAAVVMVAVTAKRVVPIE